VDGANVVDCHDIGEKIHAVFQMKHNSRYENRSHS